MATAAISPNKGGGGGGAAKSSNPKSGAVANDATAGGGNQSQQQQQSEMIRIPLPTNSASFTSRLSRNPTVQKGGRGRCGGGGGRGDGATSGGLAAADKHSCSLPPQLTHALVRHTDMNYCMRNEALDLCVMALLKHSTCNESAARFIKEHMDKKHGACWHVVVGQKFGLEISHEATNILYAFFRNSTLAICLWKCS